MSGDDRLSGTGMPLNDQRGLGRHCDKAVLVRLQRR